jgi:RNA polymerase sigma-70 factor (ECF subfamily)
MVQLFYLDEQSIKEIEVITGLTESNIKVKLHRVKQKLKGFIEEDYPELVRTSA